MGLKDKLSEIGSLKTTNKNNIREINVLNLKVIEEQPFKDYLNTPKYQELKKSIEINGITNPLIVRDVVVNGVSEYYILSGRHRYYACKDLSMELVPCIVKENLTNDEANLILLDSNLCQRETLLPSEKAFSYKEKVAILGRKGKRNDLTNEKRGRLNDMLADELNVSSDEIKRYIKIASLSRNLLDKLDDKKISVRVAYTLAFLRLEEQNKVNELIDKHNLKLVLKDALELKKLSENDELIDEKIEEILLGKKDNTNKVDIKKSKKHQDAFRDICNEYFKEYLSEDMSFEQVVELLKNSLKKNLENGNKVI